MTQTTPYFIAILLLLPTLFAGGVVGYSAHSSLNHWDVEKYRAQVIDLRDKLNLLETATHKDIPENLEAAIKDKSVLANFPITCVNNDLLMLPTKDSLVMGITAYKDEYGLHFVGKKEFYDAVAKKDGDWSVGIGEAFHEGPTDE